MEAEPADCGCSDVNDGASTQKRLHILLKPKLQNDALISYYECQLFIEAK